MPKYVIPTLLNWHAAQLPSLFWSRLDRSSRTWQRSLLPPYPGSICLDSLRKIRKDFGSWNLLNHCREFSLLERYHSCVEHVSAVIWRNRPPRVIWSHSDNPIPCFEGCQIRGFGRHCQPSLWVHIPLSTVTYEKRLSSPAPITASSEPTFSTMIPFLAIKTSPQLLISKPINFLA